ncbi:hypothetical protein [Glaciecola sp. MF2-115]|uniref:hypothetical protein n=1 Tax=Glaciecola sp. MF2-115 TaxID=3384827 RepID=UPI00399F1B8D
MKKVLCALALAGISQISVAQESPSTENTIGKWDFGLRAATISFDKDTALAQGIDESAYAIGVNADYSKSNWLTSVGLDIIVYDDNDEFRQVVVGEGILNDGDVSSESSSANGMLVSVATGYQWTFGQEQDVSFALQGGFSHMFLSERAIDLCSNCYSEDIDVDGGFYAQATLMKDTGSFAIGLYVQQYLKGDGINNSLGVKLGFSF